MWDFLTGNDGQRDRAGDGGSDGEDRCQRPGSRSSHASSARNVDDEWPDRGGRRDVAEWLGTTIRHIDDPPLTPREGQESDDEVWWDAGDATAFDVRCGPDYPTQRRKTPSQPAFYRCVAVDAVRSQSEVIAEVLGAAPLPPFLAKGGGTGSHAAAAAGEQADDGGWWPGCPLPRILCVVVLVPYAGGLTELTPQRWSSEDPGCSLVSVHAIEDETLRLLRRPEAEQPPSLRLFRDFVRRCECRLGGSKDSGLLKAIALCENIEELGFSSVSEALVRRYNGTPALVTRSGHVRQDPRPEGEWLELTFDLRLWAFAARTALYQLRDSVPSACLQIAMVVQGVDDEELPERVFAVCRVQGLDLMRTPLLLSDTDQP